MCSFLPGWAVTALVQKYRIVYTAKIFFFFPYSSFTTLWEFRTNIFECFLHLLFLAVLKFLKTDEIYFKITSRYWRIAAETSLPVAMKLVYFFMGSTCRFSYRSNEIRRMVEWEMHRKCIVASTEGFFLFLCACICPRDGHESIFGLISEPMSIQREISGSSSFYWVLESFLLKRDLGSEMRTWAGCGDQTPLQCGMQCWMLPVWLSHPPSAQQVPVVAIITTGGGLKSMTGLYGSLMGLKKLNLLDCITYISGLSGTTW